MQSALRLTAASVALTVAHPSASVLAQQACPVHWSLAPDQVYATEDPPLTRVRAMTLGPQGQLAVADAGSGSVILYDSNGRFERLFGGAGSGPGEFRKISNILFVGDSLWVADTRLFRGTLFGPAGKVVRTVPFNTLSAQFGETYPLGQGYMVFSMQQSSANSEDRLRVLTVDRGGMVRDSVHPGLLTRNAVAAITYPGGTIFAVVPAPAADRAAVTPGGTAAITVRGSVDENGRRSVTVTKIGPQLDTLFSQRVAVGPASLSRAFVDAEVDILVSRYAKYFPTRRAAETAIHNAWHADKFVWPVQALVIGTDMRTWIQTTPARNEWIVVGPTGALVGCVDAPKGVAIMAADGQHVWGTQLDALDVPSIVRFSIMR